MSPDRYGERPDEPPEEAPDAEAVPVDAHTCDRGWVDREADHPVPCLVCRPNLAPGLRLRLGQM